MRDSGRDRDPAGCEVSRGSPAGKRAHLGSASAEELLTEEPSCEAVDMTAPETFTTASKRPLTTGRRPDMTAICAQRTVAACSRDCPFYDIPQRSLEPHIE